MFSATGAVQFVGFVGILALSGTGGTDQGSKRQRARQTPTNKSVSARSTTGPAPPQNRS